MKSEKTLEGKYFELSLSARQCHSVSSASHLMQKCIGILEKKHSVLSDTKTCEVTDHG